MDAGSLHVGALDYGNNDAKPVVLTHGLADSAWSLDVLARSLADRFRVISLDLRGHGRSDWGAYTLPHFVGDLVGVCETLGLEQPALVGHSLGGQAVAQFCGLFPEMVSAAVLIEGLGPPPRRSEQADPVAYERTWTRTRVDLVRRAARHRPHVDLDAAVARFRQVHPLLDYERAQFLVAHNTLEDADGSRLWRHDPSCRDWLAGHDHLRAEQRWQGVECPIQVVLGADAWETFWKTSIMAAEDLEGPMTQAEVARRVGLFGDATVVEIAGAGHMVHYDKPEELNQVVGAFLDDQLG